MPQVEPVDQHDGHGEGGAVPATSQNGRGHSFHVSAGSFDGRHGLRIRFNLSDTPVR